MLASLAAWSPWTLFAVVVGYLVVVMGAILAPVIAPVVREARRAQREGREPKFELLQPYPVYLLRYRRAFLALLCLPIVLIGAWLWARS